MQRYRKQFKQVWKRAEQNINEHLYKILSKAGETKSDEGQSYMFRQVMEVKMHKQILMFAVKVEFNVTDISEQFRRGAEIGKKLI